MARDTLASLLVLVMLLCLRSLPAAGVAAPERGGPFRDLVLPELDALARAAAAYAEVRTGSAKNLTKEGEREVRRRYAEALADFRRSVTRHWPYDLASGMSPAAKALGDAVRFEREQYLKGRAGRDEAAARYLAVADKFPNTPEHDRALFLTYKLYTTKLVGGAKRNPEAAKKVLQRLKQTHPRNAAGPPAGKRVPRAHSDAAKAYQAAKQFDLEEYQTGGARREQAVARYVAVAGKFPSTVEHDRALFLAATLYGQRRAGNDEADVDGARGMYARLASRPGPPTSYVILAEENLASIDPDPSARMKNRSDHYLRVASRRELGWLARNLLAPSPTTSPRVFSRRVSEALITLRAVQCTTAVNMVADAVYTAEPLEALLWLGERHRGDRVVKAELTKAVAHVRRSKDAQAHVRDTDAKAIEEMLSRALGTHAEASSRVASAAPALRERPTTPAAQRAIGPARPGTSLAGPKAPRPAGRWLLVGSALFVLAGAGLALSLVALRRRRGASR